MEIYENVKKSYYENLFNVTSMEENIQMIFYSMIAFFIPFVLGHPQILVGIIVNAALILGATYLKGHKLLPIILLPSIGVICAGVIFGNYTIYLLLMMPFIWIGNGLYTYVYKHYSIKNKNKNTLKNNFAMLKAVGISSIIKAAFLFTVAFILVSLNVLPAIFLTAMGILQITTAIIGGIVAIGIINIRNKIKG